MGTRYYYAVVAVDENGKKGGLTNLTEHKAAYGPVEKLGKVFAVPNPFIIKSGSESGDDDLMIYGLPQKAEIKIYSYSGQLVQTINHEVDQGDSGGFGLFNPYVKISRNEQWIASGVYYFTVEDKNTGKAAWNKFVIIH